MDAVPPILIGAVVAAVIAVAVRHVIRARLRRAAPERKLATRQLGSDITISTIGVALMVLSVLVGTRLLSVEPPPRKAPFAAGVGVAPEVNPRPGRGFVVGLAARFRGCDDPVEVTVAVAGTAEYFEDNAARLGKRTAITIAVPTKDVRDVTLHHGDVGYWDAINPHLAAIGDWLPEGSVRTRPTRTNPVYVTSVGGDIAEWSSHLTSLLVRFKADWLVDRGLGTCYLTLPPLTGEYSVFGAQDGRGRAGRTLDDVQTTESVLPIYRNEDETLFAPYDEALEVRDGVAVVEAGANEVLEFQPPANALVGGIPAIACATVPLKIGELGSRGADLVYGGGTSAHAIRSRRFSEKLGELDCRAVVTLSEAGARNRRDLVLLLVGAVFSLGAAMLLEIGLDMQRRRFARASAT